jgi:hypothetical protein
MNEPETFLACGGSSEAEAVAKIVAEHICPITLSPASGQVIAVPKGFEIKSVKPLLDEYLTQPERRKGTATLQDLDSFIAHGNRFKGADSALFAVADRQAPSIRCVFDYHPANDKHDDARHGEHQAVHKFPLSDEWKAWMKADGEVMEQVEFAAFLEERAIDIIAPPANLLKLDPGTGEIYGREVGEADAGGSFGPRTPDEELAHLVRLLGGTIATPSRMVQLSRGLEVYEQARAKQDVNLSSGERTIAFSAEHLDGEGEKIAVPNLFLIAIPVFLNGPRYRMAVRLRYRLSGGTVKWFFEVYRHEQVFDHAFSEAAEKARLETGLPLFLGTPEMNTRS